MARKAKKKTKAGNKSRPLVVPKPAAKPPKAVKSAVVVAAAPQAPPVVVEPVVKRKRPNDVRDMNREELEIYAMELGLMKRALELTDDRLRQNIMAFIMHTRE